MTMASRSDGSDVGRNQGRAHSAQPAAVVAPALTVRGLSKRFGERLAFDDISFDVDRGEVFGFLGPNGAGKTTLVRTLGTLLAPTAGAATVAGIPLTRERSRHPAADRDHAGVARAVGS
jgi:ABC-type Na+ transport system ATPase subunit NatA